MNRLVLLIGIFFIIAFSNQAGKANADEQSIAKAIYLLQNYGIIYIIDADGKPIPKQLEYDLRLLVDSGHARLIDNEYFLLPLD